MNDLQCDEERKNFFRMKFDIAQIATI